MRSWKTTFAGLLGGFGIALVTAVQGQNEPGLMKLGLVMAALGSTITGLVARDDNVTSEGTKACKTGLTGQVPIQNSAAPPTTPAP